MERFLAHLAIAVLASAAAAVVGFFVGGKFGDTTVYFSEFNAAVRGAVIAATITLCTVLLIIQLRTK